MKAELHVIVLVKVADHIFDVLWVKFSIAIFSQIATDALARKCAHT